MVYWAITDFLFNIFSFSLCEESLRWKDNGKRAERTVCLADPGVLKDKNK